ncbi:D-lyxose/D-mannose family sugar isomerase, partial [Rhizobium ruizarguesonis]
MKLSEINAALLRATENLERWHWSLPAWGSWAAADFAAHPEASAYLRAHQLGWDVTAFGEPVRAEIGEITT